MDKRSLPDDVRTDIERAASGLKAMGATEVFLFGSFSDSGKDAALHFWRDHSGHEVDLIERYGGELTPFEIKSGMTLKPEHFKGLIAFSRISEGRHPPGRLVYGGDGAPDYHGMQVVGWREWCLQKE